MVFMLTCLHYFHDLYEFVHVFSGSHETFQHESLEMLIHLVVYPTHHLHTGSQGHTTHTHTHTGAQGHTTHRHTTHTTHTHTHRRTGSHNTHTHRCTGSHNTHTHTHTQAHRVTQHTQPLTSTNS